MVTPLKMLRYNSPEVFKLIWSLIIFMYPNVSLLIGAETFPCFDVCSHFFKSIFSLLAWGIVYTAVIKVTLVMTISCLLVAVNVSGWAIYCVKSKRRVNCNETDVSANPRWWQSEDYKVCSQGWWIQTCLEEWTKWQQCLDGGGEWPMMLIWCI